MIIHKICVSSLETIGPDGLTHVQIPRDAELLTAQRQSSSFGSGVMLWYRTSGNVAMEEALFSHFPTGVEWDETQYRTEYVATVESPSGFIGHLHRIYKSQRTNDES